jgi:hypothetical protein
MQGTQEDVQHGGAVYMIVCHRLVLMATIKTKGSQMSNFYRHTLNGIILDPGPADIELVTPIYPS